MRMKAISGELEISIYYGTERLLPAHQKVYCLPIFRRLQRMHIRRDRTILAPGWIFWLVEKLAFSVPISKISTGGKNSG